MRFNENFLFFNRLLGYIYLLLRKNFILLLLFFFFFETVFPLVWFFFIHFIFVVFFIILGLFFWDYKTLRGLFQMMFSIFVFSAGERAGEDVYKFFSCSFYDLLFFFWFFLLLFSWFFFFVFDFLLSVFFFVLFFCFIFLFFLIFFFFFFGYDPFGFFSNSFSWVSDIQYDQEVLDKEEVFLLVVFRYFFLHFLNLFQVFFDFFNNLVVEEDYFLVRFYDSSYFELLNENAAVIDFFFMEMHALFHYFVYVYYFFAVWRVEIEASELFIFLSYVFGFLLCGNFETEVDLFDEYMYIRTKPIGSSRVRTNFSQLLKVDNRDFNLLRFFFSFIRNTRDLAVPSSVFSSLSDFNKQLMLQSTLFISPVEQELDEQTLLDFYFFGFFSFFVFFKFNVMPRPHVYFFDGLLKSRFLKQADITGFVNIQFSNYWLFLDCKTCPAAFTTVNRGFFFVKSPNYAALKFLVTDDLGRSYLTFVVRSKLFFEVGGFAFMRTLFFNMINLFGVCTVVNWRVLSFEKFFFNVFIDFFFFFFRFFIGFSDYINIYYLFYQLEGPRIFIHLVELGLLYDEDFFFIFFCFVINKLSFLEYFKNFDLALFLLNISQVFGSGLLYYEVILPAASDSQNSFYLAYEMVGESVFSNAREKKMVVSVENYELLRIISALVFQAKVDLFINSDFFVYYFVFIGNSHYCLIYINERVFLFPLCGSDLASFVNFDFFFSFFKSI